MCDTGDRDDDGDGVDDRGDRAPKDPLACGDADDDGCDDCASGASNPADDGDDRDSDGLCDSGDDDDDGDGVNDSGDDDPEDPNVCRDRDGDGCDDCTYTGDDGSGGDPGDDGDDGDDDGVCDRGEGDTDGDGVPDPLDEDADNDGMPNSREGEEDTDDDGTPNWLDPDSDGDGIPDLVEAGAPDTDGDGKVDDFLDENGNGLHDDLEGRRGSLPTPDTDDDGWPDTVDLDADGDGVPDLHEAGLGEYDEDRDRRVDADRLQDGGLFEDPAELLEDPDIVAALDPDDDGVPNWLDDDSDRDGIADAIEAHDHDADGRLDPDAGGGGDDDGDGLLDLYLEASAPPDYDDDGIPDYLDDDDGLLTADERRTSESTGLDDDALDRDGQPNHLDRDSDGDGWLDGEEGAGDQDNDGIPDYLDEPQVRIAPGGICSLAQAGQPMQPPWMVVLLAGMAWLAIGRGRR